VNTKNKIGVVMALSHWPLFDACHPFNEYVGGYGGRRQKFLQPCPLLYNQRVKTLRM
jgi:hypothetical protein